MQAFSADKIFNGSGWLHNHALIINNGKVADIIPTHFVPTVFPVKHYSNCFIAPCFIDVQVYGASSKLFSAYPSIDSLNKLYKYSGKGGAKYFLPTVATNTNEVFYKCIDTVREYWKADGKGILGLHIEGPWINKDKRGAHIEELVTQPERAEVEAILDYGKDVIRMITLAPEVCSTEIVGLIQSRGVIVSAGHSNATYKQAINAFDSGIKTATHLFNAMSALQHREPGLAGAILNHRDVMCSIIPDGHHVDYAAISIAKKVMKERLFIITDAVTETPEGPYPHQLDGDKYVANGILSGSALTMMKGVRNCVEHAGIELDEALRMASLYPAKMLGLENELGKLEKGFRADFVVINNKLEVAKSSV